MILTSIARSETALSAPLSPIRYVLCYAIYASEKHCEILLQSSKFEPEKISQSIVSCPRVGFVGAV